jgi:hypothetical protein
VLQEIWWSLYLGREFSLNIANASIPLPTPENLPRDDIPWILPGVDDVPRPTLYNEGFVEGCKLCIIVTKIMQTVYVSFSSGTSSILIPACTGMGLTDEAQLSSLKKFKRSCEHVRLSNEKSDDIY